MKILVPTDFSTFSFNAFDLAMQFARASGGEILLMHVIEPPSASFSSMGEQVEANMDNIYVVQLSEKIEYELKALQSANSEVLITTIMKLGDPFVEINDLAQWEKVDMIIMGEKGVSEVEGLFVGSLTDKVVRSSRCPVITVNQSIENRDLAHLLYATDLLEEHPKLVRLLKDIQELFDATLHIVKINTRLNYANDIDTDLALKHLVAKYGLENAETHTYAHEDEEDGIIYFADKIKADLIAMGVHKKSGFRRLISGGDLAQDVAEHSARPVLTFHFDARHD